MRVCVFLLVIVPLVKAVPHPMLSNPFMNTIMNLMHNDQIQAMVTDLYHSMGNDNQEMVCEAKCHVLMETQFAHGPINTLGHSACPLVCHSFQELVHLFHLTPGTTPHMMHPTTVAVMTTDTPATVAPTVTETTMKPMVTETTMKPMVTETTMKPTVTTALTMSTPLATQLPTAAAVHNAKKSFGFNPILNRLLHAFSPEEIRTLVTAVYTRLESADGKAGCYRACRRTAHLLGRTPCSLICRTYVY